MIIREISREKAARLLREWCGYTYQSASAEKEFCNGCKEFVFVEIETPEELKRLREQERYLTQGHKFNLVLRLPGHISCGIRKDNFEAPAFFTKAKHTLCYDGKEGRFQFLPALMIRESELDAGIELVKAKNKAKSTQIRPSAASVRANVVQFPFLRYSS